MSKSVENQDNGLFALDIEAEEKTKKGRGRWPDKQLSQKPENKPMDIPDPGIVPANINKLDDIDIVNDSSMNKIDIKLLPDIIRSIEEIGKSVKLKDKMTERELKFIELHLAGGYTIENAMKLAGYEGYHLTNLYLIAKKITEKYERQAGDHRDIMRKLGFGEVKVFLLLIDSATNARSELVRLQARIALAKCLGVTKEVMESSQGVTVIIQGPDACVQVNTGQPGQPPTPTQQAPYQHPISAIPGKPIQIVK